MADKNSDATPNPDKEVSGTEHHHLIETSLKKRDSIVIGRGNECDVVVHDMKASRQHCRLTRKDDGFLLEDLGSRNGTIVDGKRIKEPVLLKANQTFQVGDTMFYLS